MAVLFQNNAEGGTAGSAVTAANSGGGSGDAFPLIGAPGSLTFSDVDPLGGSLSYRSAHPNSSGQGNILRLTGSFSVFTQRHRRRFDRAPTGATVIMFVGSGSGTVAVGSLVVGADGRLGIQSNGGSITYFGSVLPFDGTPVWVESVFIPRNSATGTARVRWYTTDPANPGGLFESTTFNLGGSPATRIQWGRHSGNWPALVESYDDFAVTDEDAFIGPVSSATPVRVAKVVLGLNPTAGQKQVRTARARPTLGIAPSTRSSQIRRAAARVIIGLGVRGRQQTVRTARGRVPLQLTPASRQSVLRRILARIGLGLQTRAGTASVARTMTARAGLGLQTRAVARKVETRRARPTLVAAPRARERQVRVAAARPRLTLVPAARRSLARRALARVRITLDPAGRTSVLRRAGALVRVGLGLFGVERPVASLADFRVGFGVGRVTASISDGVRAERYRASAPRPRNDHVITPRDTMELARTAVEDFDFTITATEGELPASPPEIAITPTSSSPEPDEVWFPTTWKDQAGGVVRARIGGPRTPGGSYVVADRVGGHRVWFRYELDGQEVIRPAAGYLTVK